MSEQDALATWDGMRVSDALLAIDGGGTWVLASEHRRKTAALESALAEAQRNEGVLVAAGNDLHQRHAEEQRKMERLRKLSEFVKKERDDALDHALQLAKRLAEAQRERDEARAERDRTAPVQGYPQRIPWAVHLKAYETYMREYGSSQTAERLAERGGFAVSEMDALHPTWRDEVEELPRLRAENAALKDHAEVGRLLEELRGKVSGGPIEMRVSTRKTAALVRVGRTPWYGDTLAAALRKAREGAQ